MSRPHNELLSQEWIPKAEGGEDPTVETDTAIPRRGASLVGVNAHENECKQRNQQPPRVFLQEAVTRKVAQHQVEAQIGIGKSLSVSCGRGPLHVIPGLPDCAEVLPLFNDQSGCQTLQRPAQLIDLRDIFAGENLSPAPADHGSFARILLRQEYSALPARILGLLQSAPPTYPLQ